MKNYSISQRKKSRGNLTWYGRTFEDGKLVDEVSLKTTSKGEARMWLDAMNATRFIPENLISYAKKTEDRQVDEAVSAFLTSVRSEKGPESATFKAYDSRLRKWVDDREVVSQKQANIMVCESFRKHLGDRCERTENGRERDNLW